MTVIEQQPFIEVGHAARTDLQGYEAGAEAAKEARASIRFHKPSVVLVFASSRQDVAEVVRGVGSVFRKIPIFGGSTAGEISNGWHNGGVLVTVLASPFLSVSVGVGEAVSRNWSAAVEQAISQPGVTSHFDGGSASWRRLTQEGKSAFAFILSPGETNTSDAMGFEILEVLKQRSLGQLPIFGMGTAVKYETDINHVFAGDRAIPDGLVVATFETQLRFGIAMAHGLRAMAERATVTAVRGRDVLELDRQPAADVYARMLGVTRESLEGKQISVSTATVAGVPGPIDSYIPNVASTITPEGGVRFAMPVPPGALLTRMRVDAETSAAAGREVLNKAMARAGIARPAIAIANYCGMRQVLLGDAASAEVPYMMEALGNAPLVGFASYGEQGLSDDGVPVHMNCVIGTLVIGNELSQTAHVARENEELRRKADFVCRRTKEELEQLVAERTSQLTAANEQLRSEMEQRTRMTTRLMQADRLIAMGTLAAGVTHEINNPLACALTGLNVVSELVSAQDEKAREAVLPDAQEAVADMRSCLERIRQAIRDLGTFSCGDEITRRPLEIADVLERSIRMALSEIRPRARIEKELGAVPQVEANEYRTCQVFLNLLANAAQAIPEGAADKNEIRIVTRTDSEGRAVIEIRDTGCGIPSENLERIFEPFFTTKPIGAGTGLGLAICREMTLAMGGQITVESQPGKGSTFSVVLPPAKSAELEPSERFRRPRNEEAAGVEPELAASLALSR